MRKEISFAGLLRQRPSYDTIVRGMAKGAATAIVARLLEQGELVAVHVEGWKEPHLALGSDGPLLDELSAGRVPAAWAPLETTTSDEAVFLAPLDHQGLALHGLHRVAPERRDCSTELFH